MLQQFEPKNPDFKTTVENSFKKQQVMQTINASLLNIEPGKVEIELQFSEQITQQHGFVHAGIVSTVIDSACGYAALSLMPAGYGVLSIEFKVNLLAPARGEKFRAVGLVKKAGKTITVTEGELIAYDNNKESVVATMVATMMNISGRKNIEG